LQVAGAVLQKPAKPGCPGINRPVGVFH
jgi:hypothetical protein